MVRLDPEAARACGTPWCRLRGTDRLLVTVWTFDAYCRTASGPGADADREERIRQGLTPQVQSDAGAGAGARAGVRCRWLTCLRPGRVSARAAGGGSVPDVRRDGTYPGCPSGLASAMAPDMPRSMLVTMIVCLMGYSLHFIRHLVGCRGERSARFGAAGCLETGENATDRSIGGTWPSRGAAIGMAGGLEAVMHNRHMVVEAQETRAAWRAGRGAWTRRQT
jgi:hypothetical protein